MILTPRKPNRSGPQVDRPWDKIESYRTQSGSRSYTISLGDRVRVQGLRGGSTGDWSVRSIERHREDGRVVVEVGRRGAVGALTRLVPSDRVRYMRQK